MEGYTTKVTKAKEDAVQIIQDRLKESRDFVFANYRGLSVEQITQLRRRLREKNAEFRVIKNRTAKIAFDNLEYPEGVKEYLVGPTAVALAYDETGPVVKELLEFAKDSPVELKGGIIDGAIFDHDQMEAFSKLPTRDELIAKLMSAMNGPVTNLALTLNAVPQKLVRVLQAVKEKKDSEG